MSSKEGKNEVLSLLVSKRKCRVDSKQISKSNAAQRSISISSRLIKKAKRTAALMKPGSSLSPSKKKIMRVSPQMLRMIIEFALHPDNLQEVSYGSFSYQMENATIQVPAWQRKERRSALARKFLQNLPAEVINKPSYRFVFNVLSQVCRKDMKSLAGLDEIAVSGKEAFADLQRIAKEYLTLGGPSHQKAVDFICDTAEVARITMKQHFVENLQANSLCSSHCVNYSLCSDDPAFQSPCNGHDSHTAQCTYCNNVEDILLISGKLLDGLKYIMIEFKSVCGMNLNLPWIG